MFYLAGPTLISIWVDQMQDEVFCIVADVLPVSLVEDNRVLSALPDKVLEVLTAERRVTTEQSVSDNTHGPHIHRLSMTFLAHHLGGSITERASHGLERLALSVEHLGNTEVGQDKVRIGIFAEVKEVLGLEI